MYISLATQKPKPLLVLGFPLIIFTILLFLSSPSINNSSINNQQQALLGLTIHNAKDTKLTKNATKTNTNLVERAFKRIDSPFISFKQYTYGDDLPEQGVDGGNRGGGARPYGPGLQSEDRP